MGLHGRQRLDAALRQHARFDLTHASGAEAIKAALQGGPRLVKGGGWRQSIGGAAGGGAHAAVGVLNGALQRCADGEHLRQAL